MSYLSLLPTEVFALLFLYIPSDVLLIRLYDEEYKLLLNRLINSKYFWLKLWKRDVSKIREPPATAQLAYAEYINLLLNQSHAERVLYWAKHGYEIPLYRAEIHESDLLNVVETAAKYGYLDIVKTLWQRIEQPDHFGNKLITEGAAEHGHIDIVKYMIDKAEVIDYNDIMYEAARGGHMDIVRMMLSLEANDYQGTLNGAAFGGNMDIVKLMLKLLKGQPVDYNQPLIQASFRGNIEIAQLMLEHGANVYDEAIVVAIHNKHEDIVDLIKAYKNE